MLRLNRSGFLLLEVLISITIIAAGLVYIVRSFSSSSRAVETSRRYLKAIALAEGVMWNLEAKRAVKRGSRDGEFTDAPGYRWETQVREHKDIPVNTVDLEIRWPGPRQTKQRLTLSTYLWNEKD